MLTVLPGGDPGATPVQRRINEVSASDVVAVGGGRFEPIAFWGHKDPQANSMFAAITTKGGRTIKLSYSHYLPVYRADVEGELVAGQVVAKEVAVGDWLVLPQGGSTSSTVPPLDLVVSVSRTFSRGLYNPHTATGTVVVDGVLASCYTASVSPSVAHAVLRPFMFLARIDRDLIGWNVLFHSEGLANFLPKLVHLVPQFLVGPKSLPRAV